MTNTSEGSVRAQVRPSELTTTKQGMVEDWREVPRIVERHPLEIASFKLVSAVEPDEPLFQPFPSVLVFNGYKPYQPSSCLVTFRNNDTVLLATA
jgi:hypothetical protein